MSDITNNPIIESVIEDLIGERFGRYSKYIIQERALPDARDGLKPVQRRILYGMYKEGNFHNKPYLKSAKTVGIVMGNYHPHGDRSIYDAMVRLSQPWKMNHLLVDMHGNNGSMDDDPAAAMRYTEARLEKLGESMLLDLDKDTVFFAPNFDDSELEPTVLPAPFPNLLVNGATGIAAGYATNIPPHNLNEVVDATIHRLNNPVCTLDDLMHFVKGPDFPSGGIVQGLKGIQDAFRNGKGRVVIRAKVRIETFSNMHQIIVDELPFEVNKSNLVKKIDDIRLSKDLETINAVRDESDRNGLKVVIDVKKDSDPEVTLNYLLKNTDLQVYYNYNVVAIVNKRPEQMGLSQMIDAFIAHREEVVINRLTYIEARLKARLHILEGLIKAVDVMDEIISIIRASKNKAESKNAIIDAFNFSEAQAEAIVMLQLYRLSSTDINVLQDEYKKLSKEQNEINSILQSPALLNQLIIKELKEVQKEFGIARRSEIQDEVEEIELDKTDLITNELVKVSVSQQGYIKRVSLRSFNMSESDIPGLKDNDHLIGSLEVETLDTILLMLSDGTFVYLPVYEINEHRWNDLGSHISSYAKGAEALNVVGAFCVNDFSSAAWITSVTKSGKIKQTKLDQYEAVRYSNTINSMNVKDDEVISSFITYEEDNIYIQTREGYYMMYNNKEVSVTNLRTQGVIGLNLGKNDEVVCAFSISKDDQYIVVVNENGGVKRTKVDDLQTFKRNTKGERIFKQVVSNPQYVRYAKVLNVDETMVLVDDESQSIKAVDIAIMSKDQSFSRPLKLKANWYMISSIQRVLFKVEKNLNEQIHLEI